MQRETTRTIRVDEKRLDVAMAAAGIKTDKALSQLSGVTDRTIRNIRQDGTCSFKIWNDLAAALGCNPIDLLTTQGYPDPNWAALVALSV